MSLISVHTEWDPLEEIIVGRAENARVPLADPGVFAVEYRELGHPTKVPSGQYAEHVIHESIEDLNTLSSELEKLGVKVRRPEVFDHSKKFSTPDWESDGQYNYCPRDLFLCVGTTIIEAPMTFRARQCESIAYKSLLLEYFQSGARWLSAPKPRLLDSVYRVPHEDPFELAITNDEPIFDAANIIRIGRDLLYLVSDSGNKLGAQWLQSCLGSEYRVHLCEGIYSRSHIDTTFTLVQPGLVVACAKRVNEKNLPEIFRKWDVIYLDEVHDIGGTGVPMASKWIGLNFMMVNPSLAVVDKHQKKLISELAKRKVDVLPLQLRHSRTMGGGFHCVTLDVRRKGNLESYF